MIVNGGFESHLDGWQPFIYDQVYGRVNVTSGTRHSGSWCLRTYINPAREIPYSQKRGGGVMQALSTDIRDLDILLRFWVMPAVIGQNSHTNIRSVVQVSLKGGRSLNLSYYVAWAPPALGEFLYNTSDNTIFFLPALLHQWTHIEREVKSDFESRFGSSSNLDLEKLSVSFEMTTVSHLSTPDAFWDDVSVLAESRVSTPTTPTPRPKPTPAPTPALPPPGTATTTTTPQEAGGGSGPAIEQYTFPALLAIFLIGLAFASAKLKSRRGLKGKAAVRYCLNCGAEVDAETLYCTRCGSRQ
ncbi:zinc ribbon domain-containing protein [Candidatus Bathyarchaeota archaeon]|nr:zinc ribbon domain-containing protein [Candidatus Bathyarchaeota archaeon]